MSVYCCKLDEGYFQGNLLLCDTSYIFIFIEIVYLA